MANPKKTNVVNLSRTPKIEKGIPLPVTRGGSEFNFMLAMKVDDSFFLSKKLWDVPRAIGNIRNFAARSNIHITVRTIEDGARVWRTK